MAFKAKRFFLNDMEVDFEGSVYYGICDSEATESIKIVEIENIAELREGLSIRVLFRNGQRYSAGTPKLKLNGFDVKDIYQTTDKPAGAKAWNNGQVVDFVYDGGKWLIASVLYTLSLASSSEAGGVLIGYTANGRKYPVELDQGKMFVNVPWTDTTYHLATDSVAGLVKTGYAANGKNYPVQLSDGKMFVNIPWTDTTYGIASSSAPGLVKIGYAQNNRNYPVQLSNSQMYVNVPWTDTNTTYEPATATVNGLMSSTDKVKLDGLGTVMGNAGAHNCLYVGKYLGDRVTDTQWAAISAGTFDNLFIGDYWVINGVTWRIAAFDYWYDLDDCYTHHVVIVPDSHLLRAKYNDDWEMANTGYYGCDFRMGANGNTGKADATNQVYEAFGSGHIMSYPMWIQQYIGVSNNRMYHTRTYVTGTVELMSGVMIYGYDPLTDIDLSSKSEKYRHIATGDVGQLPLFMFNHGLIVNNKGYSRDYWIQECMTSDDGSHVTPLRVWGWYDFGGALIDSNTQPQNYSGIRPVFAIKG